LRLCLNILDIGSKAKDIRSSSGLVLLQCGDLGLQVFDITASDENLLLTVVDLAR
jgi:hypothetical protein